jgi:hypothetical protein
MTTSGEYNEEVYKYKTVGNVPEDDILERIGMIDKKDYLISYDHEHGIDHGNLSWTLFRDLVYGFKTKIKNYKFDSLDEIDSQFIHAHFIMNKKISSTIYNNAIFQIYKETNFFKKYKNILYGLIARNLVDRYLYPYIPNPCIDFLFVSNRRLIFIKDTDTIESHDIHGHFFPLLKLHLYHADTKECIKIGDIKILDRYAIYNIFGGKLLQFTGQYLREYSIEYGVTKLDRTVELQFNKFGGNYHSHYACVNKEYYVVLSTGTTSLLHIYNRGTYSLYLSKELDAKKFPAVTWEHSLGWSRFMTIYDNKLFIASHISSELCYIDLITLKMYSSKCNAKSDCLHNGKIYKLQSVP